MENTTELAVSVQNVTQMNAGMMVTSFKADPKDRKTSAKIFNAMNNPQNKVADCINQTIAVTDYLIEMTEIENQETGEVDTVPRVVLVDDKGEAYQAVSFGMYNVVRNTVAVCGDAPWVPPVKLKIKQVPVKRGSMLTADMVG